jgi:hypothetical protein
MTMVEIAIIEYVISTDNADLRTANERYLRGKLWCGGSVHYPVGRPANEIVPGCPHYVQVGNKPGTGQVF